MNKSPAFTCIRPLRVAAFILLGALPASAQLLQSWQFNDSTGTALNAVSNSFPGGATFNLALPGVSTVSTNGNGAMVIASSILSGGRSYADIVDISTGIVQVDVNISGWNFTGITAAPDAGPLAEFGFSDNIGGNANRTAHIMFEADNVAGVTIWGAARSDGGNGVSTAASTPSTQDQIFGVVRTTPITVRLLVNFDTLDFTVTTSDANFTGGGAGKIASGKPARFLCFRALDDFTIGGTGGNLTIDSITVTNIPVLTPLQTWLQANFNTTTATGNAADNADPDGDGVANLIEYIADTNPNVPSANPVVAATFTDVNGTFLTLTYPRRAGDTSLTYTVQAVSDLATPFTTGPGATVTTGNSSTYTDTVATGAANPRRFLRLSVTR